MTVLLPTDQVELYAPEAADAHGWELPPRGDPDWRWCGRASLQLGPGPSDPRASEGGGAGPWAPGARQSGALYLPPEAEPVEGMAAGFRGQVWVVSQVPLVRDPSDLGGFLDTWACRVTEAPGG